MEKRTELRQARPAAINNSAIPSDKSGLAVRVHPYGLTRARDRKAVWNDRVTIAGPVYVGRIRETQ